MKNTAKDSNKMPVPENGLEMKTGDCINQYNKEFCSEEDPAGTDPDRYKYISSGKSEAKDDLQKDDYTKDSNTSTPQERMISPERGE